MEGLEIEKRAQGSGAVIAVAGELDLAVADQMQEAIDAVSEPTVVIDLVGCEFVDSTGIAVLVRAHRRFAEEGRRLVITSPREQVKRVLEVTGLTDDGLVVGAADEVLG